MGLRMKSALILSILTSQVAFASGPVGGAIQGTLFAPGGSPVTSSNVHFKVQVLDKAGTCVLYEEEHASVDLSSTNGDFSINLGSGTAKQNFVDSSAILKNNVFRNDVNLGAFTGCAGGLTFTSGDARLIRVMFDVAGGTTYVTLTPDLTLMGSPYSTVADSVQGKTPTDFIQVKDDVATDLNQTNVENIFSATNYDKLNRFLSGTEKRRLLFKQSTHHQSRLTDSGNRCRQPQLRRCECRRQNGRHHWRGPWCWQWLHPHLGCWHWPVDHRSAEHHGQHETTSRRWDHGGQYHNGRL